MPIIIEGGSRSAGSWWARHLQNTEQNERAELVEVQGLSAEAVPELFEEMRGLAQGTKCKNYFYQASINPRADEHLTPAQWREAVATLGRNLGLEGQPYFVIEHEKNGRTHRHIVWSRIDQEKMVAISDSLTARIHEQTARQLEVKFDLEYGKSILVPDRDFERPERRATKPERFRGAKSGLDPQVIASELKAIRECSDSGRSFQAGIEAAGYLLARGDRRDFVVIDQAGHDHSLGRRLGIKAAELRAFMKDVEAASLPSVAEARSRQRARQAEREARQEHAAPEVQHPHHAGAKVEGNGVSGPAREEPRPQQHAVEPKERPLGRVQGNIRLALSLTETGTAFAAALEDKGLILAEVRAADIRRSAHRELEALRQAETNGVWMLAKGGADGLTPDQLASAKESYDTWARDRQADGKGAFGFEPYVNYVQKRQQERIEELTKLVASMPPPAHDEAQMPVVPAFAKPGDLVIVSERGEIYTLSRRTTGLDRNELTKYLAPIDRGALLGVTDAQMVMREVRQERERERVQQRIDASVGKTAGEIRMAWTLSRNIDQLNEALAARGMSLARVTAEEAYASERVAAFAKEVGGRNPVFADNEIVAVNQFGSVYHLDERTTGQLRPEIAERLAGVSIDSLLSVTDAKAALKEASRAAYRERKQVEQEKSRPVTRIEQTILDAEKAAGGDQQKFAAALEKEGFVIARATPADIQALEKLRRDQQLEQMIAYAGGVQPEPERHFGRVQDGEFAAVTRRGDVFRLNPQHLKEVDKRLDEARAPLPSITQARATIKLERIEAAAFQQTMIDIQLQRRGEAVEARIAADATKDADRTIRSTAGMIEREALKTVATGESALFKTARGATSIAGRTLDRLAGMIAGALDFMAGPRPVPTREQRRAEEEAAREHERTAMDRAQQRAATAARIDDLLQQSRRQREKNLRMAQTLGTPPTAEANLNRDEHDRTRERERELGRDR